MSVHRVRRLAAATPLIATIAYWPTSPPIVDPTIDDSWRIALHQAVSQGLQWGSDLSFTFGPLGFLNTSEPFLGTTSTLAFVFAFAVYFGLTAAVYLATSRAFPMWLAILMTLVTGRTLVALPPFEAGELLVFLIAVRLVETPPRWSRQTCLVGGLATAFFILGKFNIGLFVGAMATIVAIRMIRPWWQGIALLAASTLISLAGLWLIAAQRAANLPAFLLDSIDLTRGYSDAMAINLFPWPWVLELLLLACLALIAVGGVRHWMSLESPVRIAVFVLLLTFAFSLWKGSITRADIHVELAFAALSIAASVLLAGRTNWRMAGLLWAVVLIMSHLFAVDARSYFDVADGIGGLVRQVDAVIPGHREPAIAGTRNELRAAFGLDDRILGQLRGRTVAVDPWDAAIGFAYPELRWSPVPSLQSYVAFTERLDLANAAFLRSSRAPERILRSSLVQDGDIFRSLDGRNPWFESPAAMLESLCRYSESASTSKWQVLARTASQCGPSEPLAVETATAGDTVAVPTETRQDRFVIVRIRGLGSSPIDVARSFLWKGVPWYIEVDGSIRYRLVAATAADGLIMAVPDGLASDPLFAFGAPTRSISVSAGTGGHESTATLTYEFLSVPWIQQP